MEGDKLINNIKQMKNEFYAKQGKNMFFKSKQKLELATSVANSMNLEDLMQRTIFVIKDTNKVFMDYTIFKSYANPENYQTIAKYILFLLSYCVDNFDSFEIHINLDTFSVSACHRYQAVIETYLNECLKHETPFTDKLIKMCIYNTPSVFDTIHKMLTPFIHEKVSKKIEFYNKTESQSTLAHLFV